VASLDKRPSGKWRVRWIDVDTGEARSQHFAQKRDAQAHKASIENAIHQGLYVDPKRSEMLLSDYVAKWSSERSYGEARSRVVDNALRVHVVPGLGSRRIGTINRGDIQAFVNSLHRDKGLKYGTLCNIVDVLGRMFKDAVTEGVVRVSPVVTRATGTPIYIPGREEKRSRFLTTDEVEVLRGAAPEDIRPLVECLSMTGLRIGEALGLRVGDVDFASREIRVERQRTQSGNITPTKTSKSRKVPIADRLLSILEAQVHGRRSDAPLWLNRTNGVLLYGTFKVRWDLMLERADLDWRPTAHDLRHYYASYLLQEGTAIPRVARYLGHATPAKTLAVYAHVIDDDHSDIWSLFPEAS